MVCYCSPTELLKDALILLRKRRVGSDSLIVMLFPYLFCISVFLKAVLCKTVHGHHLDARLTSETVSKGIRDEITPVQAPSALI